MSRIMGATTSGHEFYLDWELADHDSVLFSLLVKTASTIHVKFFLTKEDARFLLDSLSYITGVSPSGDVPVITVEREVPPEEFSPESSTKRDIFLTSCIDPDWSLLASATVGGHVLIKVEFPDNEYSLSLSLQDAYRLSTFLSNVSLDMNLTTISIEELRRLREIESLVQGNTVIEPGVLSFFDAIVHGATQVMLDSKTKILRQDNDGTFAIYRWETRNDILSWYPSITGNVSLVEAYQTLHPSVKLASIDTPLGESSSEVDLDDMLCPDPVGTVAGRGQIPSRLSERNKVGKDGKLPDISDTRLPDISDHRLPFPPAEIWATKSPKELEGFSLIESVELEDMRKRIVQLDKYCNDFDMRIAKASVALGRAGAPEVVPSTSPSGRALDLDERIAWLVQDREESSRAPEGFMLTEISELEYLRKLKETVDASTHGWTIINPKELETLRIGEDLLNSCTKDLVDTEELSLLRRVMECATCLEVGEDFSITRCDGSYHLFQDNHDRRFTAPTPYDSLAEAFSAIDQIKPQPVLVSCCKYCGEFWIDHKHDMTYLPTRRIEVTEEDRLYIVARCQALHQAIREILDAEQELLSAYTALQDSISYGGPDV